MAIEVNNESGTEVDERALLDIARYTLARMRIHPLSELSVIAVDAEAMEQLHLQWMDLPGPTDVMSFPMDELRPPARDEEEPPPALLGRVACEVASGVLVTYTCLRVLAETWQALAVAMGVMVLVSYVAIGVSP